MRCLVTGAAGFIGSHLCEALLAMGHTVIGLDNFSTGRRKNLPLCLKSPSFQFVRDDVVALTHMEIFSEKFDWIFHLAAKADIVPSITEPTTYHETNVNGTISMLQMARATGVKKFIYAASSSCYGIPVFYPTPEESKIQPMYPYALTKNVGEQYVMHWGKVYKVPVISLRLFNVYGPRARTTGDYGAVFGVFLSQLANKMPLTIVGDGTQKRDFTYVTDVVRAMTMAAESDISQEIFNVGSGKPNSVNYLADLLKAAIRVYIPKRPGEPDITCADIQKITSILKWKPEVTFEHGVATVRKCVEDFKRAPLWDEASIKEATKEWFKCL